MGRKTTLSRLKSRLAAMLAEHHITVKQAETICDLSDRIETVADDLAKWGDGWSKDDWPHARLRGCSRSGHIETTYGTAV